MVTTSAIILRRYNRRDVDRSYVLYTERLGKVEAIATGVRKIKSKLAPHLEPCGIVRATLVRGRFGWRLVNARREESFFLLYADLDRFAHVMAACETVDALTKPEYPDANIFTLLAQLLRERTVSLDTFLYELLSTLGYRPLPESIGPSLLQSPAFTAHLHYPLRSQRYLTQ